MWRVVCEGPPYTLRGVEWRRVGPYRTSLFALAFTCIGLETRFKELAGLGGGRPALAFVIGQGVNILWTLLLAYLLFGGILFPPPKL